MNENPTTPKCPQCGAAIPPGTPEGLCASCLLALNLGAPTAPAGGTTAPESRAPEPLPLDTVTRLFPQLEIVRLLGRGGMGAVYLARQPALDRLVALKILTSPAASGHAFAERFTREARALARLNHPAIVAVHDFGQAEGHYYLLMEFVDGLNLRQLLATQKMAPAEALTIVPKICEALQFAHEQGIVHRDIKPENILLDKQGRVKIADFGIAKLLGATAAGEALTGAQDRVGTPHYMAPEQVEKPQTVDHRADIYSLGVVFYELLTGELPLGRFAPPSRKVQLDVRLDEVVLHALEKEPERRYQQAGEIKTAVETIASSPGHAGNPPPAPTETGPAPDADQLAREILARGYSISIRHCLRRAWQLVKRDFWPLIGVTALMLALLSVASSPGLSFGDEAREKGRQSTTSVLFLLLYGPLMGGLSWYYLQKIRGHATTVPTAFVGFTAQRFLQLFLGGFVSMVLIGLGFLCLILPGIYLWVAWVFALSLIVDKKMEFWPAMELSRRVVTKHWWKFFAFFLVAVLFSFAGLLMLIVGFFVLTPIAWIAMTYAYEDIFSGPRASAEAQPATKA